MERNSQENNIHLRLAMSHSLSNLPEISAAIAKEKGTVALVKPIYKLGGWMII